MRHADAFPHRRIERVGMVRMDRHIDTAGGVRDEQLLLPALSPVGRAVEPPFGAAGKELAHRPDEDPLEIFGIDHHPGNVAGIFQAEVRPALPGIAGAVEACPVVSLGAAPGVDLAGAGIDDARVGRIQGQIADRQAQRAVKDRLPTAAGVDRAEDPPGGGTGIDGIEAGGAEFQIGDAPADIARPGRLPRRAFPDGRRLAQRQHLALPFPVGLVVDLPLRISPLGVEPVVGDLCFLLLWWRKNTPPQQQEDCPHSGKP